MRGWSGLLQRWPVGPALGLACALAVLTACSVRPFPSAPTPTARAVAAPPTPAPTPEEAAALATPPPPITPSHSLTLTWWTTEWFSPGASEASRIALAQQLDGFTAAYPDIAFRIVLKRPYGKGGLLDFLTTAARAAPKVLPDLVILDLAELDAAVGAGLVQPLDGLLPAELTADLFPFAAQAGQVNNHWYAVPFLADLEHALYDVRRLPLAPRTWTDLLQNEATYFLPLAGRGGMASDAVLSQYLSAGGSWEKEGSIVPLSPQALERTLAFLKEAHARGFIPPQALEQGDADAGWALLLSGQVAITQVRAQRYLAGRDNLRNAAYAPVPTWDGRLVTIGRCWGFAVVTEDPIRQAAAAQVITWLLDATRHATWTFAADYLPPRRSALALWGQADPYFTFLRDQLEAARHRPAGAAYDGASRALQRAVTDVLTGAASPQEAARRATENVQP